MIKANIVLDKKIWNKKLKKPEIYFKKKLNELSKLDINYLIVAYRGFSGNKGKPNEKGLYKDLSLIHI